MPEPSKLIANYFVVAMEVDDAHLLAEFATWYERKKWGVHLKKAKSLVQIVIDSNAKTPEESIAVLVKVINRFFESQRLTFYVERWEERRKGSIIDRNVVIRGVVSTDK
jgi:hypothetical protein